MTMMPKLSQEELIWKCISHTSTGSSNYRASLDSQVVGVGGSHRPPALLPLVKDKDYMY